MPAEPGVPPLRWSDVDRARRARVARAVRRGALVEDARDAPYAVAFAEWFLSRPPRSALRGVLNLLVLAFLLAVGHWAGEPLAIELVPLALLALALVAQLFHSPQRLRQNAAAARARNSAAAEQLGLPHVSLEFPAARKPSRSDFRLRRGFVFALVVVAALSVVGFVAATLPRGESRARKAERICRQEHSRLLEQTAAQLSPAQAARRDYAIKFRTVKALESLWPVAERTRRQATLIGWKITELHYRGEQIAALERGDRAALFSTQRSIRDAAERQDAVAERLGVRDCGGG